jgi:hypothetical protein
MLNFKYITYKLSRALRGLYASLYNVKSLVLVPSNQIYKSRVTEMLEYSCNYYIHDHIFIIMPQNIRTGPLKFKCSFLLNKKGGNYDHSSYFKNA